MGVRVDPRQQPPPPHPPPHPHAQPPPLVERHPERAVAAAVEQVRGRDGGDGANVATPVWAATNHDAAIDIRTDDDLVGGWGGGGQTCR